LQERIPPRIMLPSLGFLARERELLCEVMRAQVAAEAFGDPRPHRETLEAPDAQTTPAAPMSTMTSRTGGRRTAARGTVTQPERKEGARRGGDRHKLVDLSSANGGDCLEKVPPELLAGIAEHFLESPVWHACQLGAVSPNQGQIFMDESLWTKFFEGRFRTVSRSPRRQSLNAQQSRSPSPSSVRLTYAQLHMLEMRFREGLYGARSALDNPRKGVAVLDLRIAPDGWASSQSLSSETSSGAAAFAALRDGTVMMYDLEQESRAAEESEERSVGQPLRVVKEFTPSGSGGPALCCLPLTGAVPPMLTAGYSNGRLCAWELPGGANLAPQSWEEAHADRVTSLAALGSDRLLSASADGLVKAWDLGNDRFGQQREIFSGHGALVASVATPSPDGAHGGEAEQLFLTGGHDRTMRLWDARQGGVVGSWNQRDWVTCVDFHPTAQHMVLSSDKSVHEWDLRRFGGAPVSSRHRHRKLISRFRVDPMRLASCSLDGSVKVSSFEDPTVRRASPHSSPQNSPGLGPADPPLDGLSAVGEVGDVCTLRASSDYVLSIDFDATRLLTGGVDSHVDVYDFSDPGHFRSGVAPLGGSPFGSPYARPKVEPADFHMTGFMELEN